MTFERAIEILNPDGDNVWRGAADADLETVKEACRLAVEALDKRVLKQPLKTDCREFYTCPGCRTLIWRNEQSHGKRDIPHCKWCGQALDWRD